MQKLFSKTKNDDHQIFLLTLLLLKSYLSIIVMLIR